MRRLEELQEAAGAEPPAWDSLVRLTHWTVAAAVVTNGLFTNPGGALHVAVGWIVLAALTLRFIWGFLGPIEARFSSFPLAPRAALAHLKELALGKRVGEYGSHNPAGAVMVYAMWATLLLVCFTGLVLTDARSPLQIAADQAAVNSGDWSSLSGNESSGASSESVKDTLKNIHALAGNLMLVFAALHVGGVAVESRALRRNLVRPMLWRKDRTK